MDWTDRIQQMARAFRKLPCTMAIFTLLVCCMSVQVYGQRSLRIDPGIKVDEKTRAVIIDSVTQALNDYYVFPDVAEHMEKHVRSQLQKGSYRRITSLLEFCIALTNDLRSVSHDKHLGVNPMPAPEPGAPSAPSPEEERKRRLEELRKDNYGFRKVERLEGNIGYIDFRYFAEAEYGGATAVAAMNFLSNVDALIFDLRWNGGGNPSMIQLISSYLFEGTVHLNSFYVRETDETQQFWTQSHVRGPRMTDIPVYVLTSSYTFSGAEEFTYNLKNMERATIIGETTGGGAHPVSGYVFDGLNIVLRLPFGRAVNPITGTNWEGVGVEPDLKVPADEALIVARIEAAKVLRENADSEAEKQLYDWLLAGLKAEQNPVQLDDQELKTYSGYYGPRQILLEGGSLYYQREDRPKYRLTPMGNDTFAVEGLDFFRIRFRKDASGQVEALIGLYNDGRTDLNERNR